MNIDTRFSSCVLAEMVEWAYTADLKSAGEKLAGSNPALGTNLAFHGCPRGRVYASRAATETAVAGVRLWRTTAERLLIMPV